MDMIQAESEVNRQILMGDSVSELYGRLTGLGGEPSRSRCRPIFIVNEGYSRSLYFS